jgi:DNA-binding XRE family transcriptional regulator
MKRQNRETSDGIKILHKHFYAGRSERLAALEEARANDQVAREIRALRRKARLTQKELAALVGTTASVISRLEDADYEGHSMAMLRRIASALNRRVEIRFVPVQRKLKAA